MINKTISLIKTDKHVLARNAVVNLLGQSAPMAVAIFAIPILIKSLGTDRFGVLTLAWVIVGYFSLFDIGLGRALTKLVAERIGKGQTKEMSSLIWTALTLMGGLATLGVVLLIIFTPWLVNSILNIPELLQSETRNAFFLLALSIPIVITTTGLCGILEAHQRFGIINAIRVPMGIFTFLGPLAALYFSKSLVMLVSVLVAGRVVAWIFYLVSCFRVLPALRENMHAKRDLIKPLLSFGGWLTVSNIVGPIMLYADRFLIASMISITATAYYTTPYEVVIKLLVIPAAILGVMFPAFSSAQTDVFHLRHLYHQTIKYIALIMIPLILLIFLLAERALALWINEDFARNSFRVAQLLTLGVFINSFGHVSQSLIQAIGRPDITAKLHLIELPLYLIYLGILLPAYGINGAALAWVIRVSISTGALAFIANHMLTGTHYGERS